MRRLLLAAALLAALPVAPASAGPAACAVASGFPVCAGTCSSGDPVTVVALGVGQGVARCGGNVAADCPAYRGVCTGSGTAPSGGALTCGGSSAVVLCFAGIQATL